MNNSLLDRIKFLAQKKGISLAEIERQSDLSQRSIYGWKTKYPNSKALAKVADILDTNLDYLMGRSTNPNPVDKEDDPNLFFKISLEEIPEEDREIFKEDLDILKLYVIEQIKISKKRHF